MSRDHLKTARVTCPHCDAKTVFATIPVSCTVASEKRSDGKVRSECRECGAGSLVHLARA